MRKSSIWQKTESALVSEGLLIEIGMYAEDDNCNSKSDSSKAEFIERRSSMSRVILARKTHVVAESAHKQFYAPMESRKNHRQDVCVECELAGEDDVLHWLNIINEARHQRPLL